MAGQKTFFNTTDKQLQVTLLVREGEEPENSAESESFEISPGERSDVSYGNYRNIYLNGLKITIMENGEATTEQEFVVDYRGDSLDDQLNTNSVIEISYNGDSFTFEAYG